MIIRHHPSPPLLIAYAAGTLNGAISGLIACHKTVCKQCADDIRRLEMAGGVMLSTLETANLQARYTAPTNIEAFQSPLWRRQAAAAEKKPVPDPILPLPLAQYLGMTGDEIPWRQVVKGFEQYWIKLPRNAGRMRLVRVRPHFRLPRHTHTGHELTMVLKGSYCDEIGEFRQGDVADLDDETTHKPKATGEDDCICLIASENLPRYSQLSLRLMQPFLQI